MSTFDMALLGGAEVGKTALCIQICQHHFVEDYHSTTEDSYRKQMEVDGSSSILDINELGGAEEYTAMRDLFMKNATAFILVYSVTSASSFNSLSDVREQITRIKDTESILAVLCGNKTDLADKREVTTEQGKELALKWGCPFFETSAKDFGSVEPVFIELLRMIRRERAGHAVSYGPPFRRSKGRCILC